MFSGNKVGMVALLVTYLSIPIPLLASAVTTITLVQSIELQGNKGGTGKSRQNSRGTGIAKLAGAAPLMEAPL